MVPTFLSPLIKRNPQGFPPSLTPKIATCKSRESPQIQVILIHLSTDFSPLLLYNISTPLLQPYNKREKNHAKVSRANIL
ncbi:MAG: hypothetical protein IJI26_02660, partial [Clostridia bacterium]|nr:hypothetical protein [Clostridia bacterium]